MADEEEVLVVVRGKSLHQGSSDGGRQLRIVPRRELIRMNQTVQTASSENFSSRVLMLEGCLIAPSDGSGRFLSENIDVNLLRSLFTRSGGEVTGEF